VARLATIDLQIAEIDKQLAVGFPDYAALVNPGAVSVENIQAQLDAAEALVLFLDTPELQPIPEESFLWAVTNRPPQSGRHRPRVMYSYNEAHQHDGNDSNHGAGKNIDQVVTAFGQRGDNHEGIRDRD
jgi:hypothetical protein